MTVAVPLVVAALVVFAAGWLAGERAERRDHSRLDRLRRELETHRGDR